MKTSRVWRVTLALVLTMSSILAPLAAAQTTAPVPAMPPEPSSGAQVGAGVLNVVYVPGKVIICSAGTLASAGLMLLTFGQAYHAAVRIFDEGCGGPWVLTPDEVAGRRPPEDRSY